MKRMKKYESLATFVNLLFVLLEILLLGMLSEKADGS